MWKIKKLLQIGNFLQAEKQRISWENIFVLGLYYSGYFLFIGVERSGR